MYLKAIKTQGFKSFADKITIELENNITGIVGPNGSGKSNVVDAIRWVLGEQSIKSLRGDGNMTDVIFSGSKTRNASSMASVTLVLDNTDNYLPLNFNEVAIKRRVYKDGSNEYYLNEEKVRLKDIVNLLLDSGIAKESFNIISQGKIDEILSNKPEDRRVIFEEAAGVLKYKRRKEEALRKLDKTHNNMSRVEDIISELEVQVEPLKEQKEKALIYQKIKEELEENEIALITNDITNLNFDYQNKKDTIAVLEQEIQSIEASNHVGESEVEKKKLDIDLLEKQIKEKQEELLVISTKVEQINSRKQIILERQRYTVEDSKYHENLVSLKEKEWKLKNQLLDLKNKKDTLEIEIIELTKKLEAEQINLQKVKESKHQLEQNLQANIREENQLNLKMETLRYSIDSNATLPVAVKKVLENPKLRGIHNAIGNLFDVEEKYSIAISTALGMATTNIVVDDDNAAKEAINFLKTNNIGRATFFPITIINPKGIDRETLDKTNGFEGYIGVASDLIKYDKTYANILLNQLGNVLVVDNLDHATKLARFINHRYRIVTLDGELLHVGGSLTGGKVITTRNMILEKYELEKYQRQATLLNEQRGKIEEKSSEIDDQLRAVEDKIYLLNKDKVDKEVIISNYQKSLLTLEEEMQMVSYDLVGTDNLISQNLAQEEEEILKEYYETIEVKNKIEITLNQLIKDKDNLKEQLIEMEYAVKKENSSFVAKSNELKELEIAVNRLDVKLDNLLNNLSENYSLTYEAAIKNYKLEIPVDIARNKVNSLKRQMKEIGIVNLGAIEEYDRVSSRYEFLLSQREDLVNAENTLLKIIEEMDKVMVSEFAKTFEIINENFKQTFKELFKGGNAALKLTDPNNILDTGIEIIASPPGKKLTTISLLSGGEKTFTAISLLFAILKSKPVPFCVLDEVEAALDDANVDSFGKYVRSLKDKTQFIIITHKKRTMEYVDTLYGITMQESGVSKLVSVKLEEI